jgi:peptidase M42 family hydrolase
MVPARDPHDPAPDRPAVDLEYITALLMDLLAIPSPTGYTDEIVHRTGQELEHLGIPFELTRRGAIRADLKGKVSTPDRAIVAHLDTLGAMVRAIQPNGRLALAPIGTWSSRFAEGARVKVFSGRAWRTGTILPMKASGHTFHEAVDTQPIHWDSVEVRIDEVVHNGQDVRDLGIRVGDFVAVDPQPTKTQSGFINARHLDDKAGVAVTLGAAKAVLESGRSIPVDCHLVFTISEEVGSGSSHTLHRDVAEMVTIDTAPQAPGQNASEFGVTLGMMDSTGPFDYHLTQKLMHLCEQHHIPFQRDLFRYYRSDSASAVEAGNDLRTALACFGVDASHGWERTHTHALQSLAELLVLYVLSDPTFQRDAAELAPLEGFPRVPTDAGAPTHPEEEDLPTDSQVG